MKRILAGLAIATALTPAWGADVPPPVAPIYRPPPTVVAAAYNWSGFYIGANGGYAWGRGDATMTLVGNAFGAGTVTGDGKLDGPLAGGQIGFNWQTGILVLGAEVDGQWSGQKLTSTVVGCGVCPLTETFKSQWFATARARLGVAWDNVLLYGTGGVALTNLDYRFTGSTGGATVTILELSDNKVGWTAGGGLEIGISRYVSAKVEYLYIATSGFTATGPVPAAFGGGTATARADLNAHVARFGLNFRFPVGGVVVARY